MSTKIKLSNKILTLHKSIVKPKFDGKTVLVNDPWEYVEMWLKRNNKSPDAIFYWQQAKQFYLASQMLPLTSSPLTNYYCLLNATKTLLLVHNIPFSDQHGVSGRSTNNRVTLSNETITIHKSGVLPALCLYLDERILNPETFTLKTMLYNLPFIHRSYVLTYTSDPELFIPIKKPSFNKKSGSDESWFSFELEERNANQRTLNKLPATFERDLGQDSKFVIRYKKRFKWNRRDTTRINKLTNYHKKIRKDIFYISGLTRLWYIKRIGVQNIIKRSTLPLMFAGMHRLSELSRYEPVTLSKHLSGQQNWLLSEFIRNAPAQFLDEIASEITGEEFMTPGMISKPRV